MDVKTLLEICKEKNVASNVNYNDTQLSEIAVNCISLSNAWLSKAKNGMSFKLVLARTEVMDDVVLEGVTSETLPIELFEILTTKNDKYSSVSLVGYSIGENKEMVSERLGIVDVC